MTVYSQPVCMFGISYPMQYLLSSIVAMSAPTIEVHPNSICIIEGEEVTLTVCGISSDLTFKWEKKGIGELNDPGYIGKETDKLTICSYSSSNHDGEYHCKVSRGDGSIISSSAALKGID